MTNLETDSASRPPMTLDIGRGVIGDLAVRGYTASLHCAPDGEDTVRWWIRVEVPRVLNGDSLHALLDVATAHSRELVVELGLAMPERGRAEIR